LGKLRLSLERIFRRGAFRRPVTIAQSGAVLHVKLRAGVWSVSLDGAFYGDYRAKDWAVEAAKAKAHALRGQGLTVRVLILSTDGAIESNEALGPLQAELAATPGPSAYPES
jgi:hypothetical protein